MEFAFIHLLALIAFWGSLLFGCISTLTILPFLQRFRMYKKSDRKETLYGTKAVEFERIRKQEEQELKRVPVSRVGGLTFLPTIIIITGFLSGTLHSDLFVVVVLTVLAITLVMLYDDLVDIGIIARKAIRIRTRLGLFAVITLFCGYFLSYLLPTTLTFLPIPLFETIAVTPIFFAILFMLWCLFWQISSIIDGVDGLSGTIFLLLFSGTTVLSLLQGNNEALLLSAMGGGMVIPWLFTNFAPARAYLTETGITFLLILFSCITFILATGSEGGDGFWVGGIFGIVLIATWMSNIIQLWYRKKTGKKLFRIAPLHHHFEALGIPGSSVVLRYMLVTFLSVIAGISLVLIIS